MKSVVQKYLKVTSKLPEGVPVNLNLDNLEYCSIVYMCIKEPDSPNYKVPDNFQQVVNAIIEKAYEANPELWASAYGKYCYITIKRQYVQPHSIPNRYGWHIDGFKSDQDNFIWFDSIPPEVSVGDFNLTDDHDISLEEMQVQARAGTRFVHTLITKNLYHLDQTCVHNVTKNNLDIAVLRTFIKLTFSTELFNCLGNAWNYKLPHIKPTTPRKEIRNHGVI